MAEVDMHATQREVIFRMRKKDWKRVFWKTERKAQKKNISETLKEKL